MYITVTSGPSVSGVSVTKGQSVVAYYGRSSSGFVNETLLPRSGNVQDLSFFIFFLTETSEQHKGRLLAVVTFCLFLSTRFVSS